MNYINAVQNIQILEWLDNYTADGAITGLQRYGKMNNGTYGQIDNLDITLNGNQLYSITDKAAPVVYNGAFDFKDNTVQVDGAEYQYDGNGNLVSDANKSIAKIEYDTMNHPRRIQFTNGNVTEFIYTSTGEKLRTIHRTAVNNISVPIGSTLTLTTASTLSVDSTDYIGNFIFENGKADKYLFNGGYCSFASTGLPIYHYYTQDHRGNNRAVINENGTLEQVTHYYPFGGIYGDTGINSSLQPYKYNGKELDRMHGLDWYDYGARSYDPALGRFTTIDPLTEKYYKLNPYAYCGDNPVNAIDINGDSVQMNQVMAMDKIYNTDYNNKINKDLSYITGLQLSNTDTGQLQYKKDTNGNPIIDESSSGSLTARKILISILDSKETLDVFLYMKEQSSTPNNTLQIGLSAVQNGFQPSNNSKYIFLSY